MAVLFCRSFSVLVKDLNGKNHQMTVLNLLYPIDKNDSYKKVNKPSYLFLGGIEVLMCVTSIYLLVVH